LNSSPSLEKLAPALHQAQLKIKAALKDSTNPHFRSKYADLSSVVEAVKYALNSAGIVFLQGVSGVENGVAVETMLLHVSGEWMSSTLEIPASKHDAQGYGSAITYGRRYGLQAMCGVPAEDDDGYAASASAPAKHTSVSLDLWNKLEPSVQAELNGYAEQIIHELEVNGGLKAMEMLHALNIDNELKNAMWSRFTSKERAAMEPHKRPRKVANG
jgi:ERF superfamily protein